MRGWDATRIARAFAELMERLGYARYGAQGGDWGAQITTRIGALDEQHCAAIHLNMPIASRPESATPLTDADQADLAAMQAFSREESGYALEQRTKPQTIGAALNDSPAGLLAWIVEKFRAWSDCDGDPENAFAPALDALARRSRANAPILDELRRLEAEGKLQGKLADMAVSLAHMHVNRFIRSAARAHEMVLYDFLFQTHRSRAARARKRPAAG